MKIKKYIQFIKEEFNDTPESYINVALNQIKKKIDKMFEYQEGSEGDFEPSEEPKGEKSIRQAKSDSKEKSKLTFKDLGVKLESSEISKYSKMYDSLTVKFTDENATYNLFIAIDLKEALPKPPEASAQGSEPMEPEKEKNFSDEDIKNCYVKFKKYDLDEFNVIGQLTKNIKIADINEEFIIDLKIELDDKFGDEEEFKIET